LRADHEKLGTDIVDNKKTYLVIEALELASPSQKEELERWFTIKEFDHEEKISAVTSIFNDLGIREVTETKIKEYYSTALSSLEHLNRPDERKTELYNFASFLTNRKR
jgi:geranylgeranyl diphosphate synthase type II